MQPGKDYQIVPFQRDLHTAFVTVTFRQSLHGGPGPDAQFPWKFIPPRLMVERFQKEMRKPGTVVLVAADIRDPAVLMAWAACRPADNEVVFAFTGYEKRRFGLATALCTQAGVDLKRPTGVLFWTRAAQRILREHGVPLFFRCTDNPEKGLGSRVPGPDPKAQFTGPHPAPEAKFTKRRAAATV